MQFDQLKTTQDIEDFLFGNQSIVFVVTSTKEARYQFVEDTLRRFRYTHLKRKDKGTVIAFLLKMSGYSKSQLTRMIKQFVATRHVQRQQTTLNGFGRVYTPEDIRLLVALDKCHDTPNGFMIKKLCERAYHQFRDNRYIRLSGISVSHIYNIRKSSAYKKQRVYCEKTKANKSVKIGERRQPHPKGLPGYIRIDTVHQGDLDGQKGVYHINAVDEVTQWEVVISVEKISENHLIPALTLLLKDFPFKVLGFHSDNGSEYINKTVAELLNKLNIEMTKSRPRKSTDNALAEGKNAAIVRKIFGHSHIPQHHATRLNTFNVSALNPYVNYHRPCLFPRIIKDKRGKEKKKYLYEDMKTPYEKLKSLPNAAQYLRAGLSFERLDDKANEMTDTESAQHLQKQRSMLFNDITQDVPKYA